MKMDVSFDLVVKDATQIDADVLALKYAQANYGLDAMVSAKLIDAGTKSSLIRPKPGVFRLVDSVDGISAEKILFVGVVDLYSFSYADIREFSRRVLASLAGSAPQTARLIMTLHGANYGLDEFEAFEAEIAGLLDAINSRDCPEALNEIVFAEMNRGRADRLRAVLKELVPNHVMAKQEPQPRTVVEKRNERLRAAGYASSSKAHVFVAMPFKDEMDDVYHYGIQSAVRSAGFLCERADLSAFTGDVMEWVRTRIKTAKLVVADLTDANANVYLEVGYAWGCDIPTVFVVRDTDHLKFDVRSHRCLPYSKIQELEESLTKELKALKQSKAI
jgi:hypothetical protein